MNPHRLSILQQRILTTVYAAGAKRPMTAADVCTELSIHGARDHQRVMRCIAGLVRQEMLRPFGNSTMHPIYMTDIGKRIAATIIQFVKSQPANQPMWR